MRVLVTGGLGFIGSSLCESLLKQGHHVLAIDNLDNYYDPRLKLLNFDDLKPYDNFIGQIFDINNTKELTKAFKEWQPEVVMHTAGKAGVRPSISDPISYIKANLEGTTNLLETMNACGVKKLGFCSSSSVYGEREEMQFSEDLTFDSAVSFYAASKQCGELITRQYHNLYDISVINLRFFTVYGPRQRPDLAIHKFLKAAYLNEPITLFGDGSMKRDYTYIDDIVKGVTNSLQRLNDIATPLYETYNLGNSSPVSLKDLVFAIEKVTGKTLDIRYDEVPAGDVPVTFADISRAREHLDYKPTTDLEEGLSYFYTWMVESGIYKAGKNLFN